MKGTDGVNYLANRIMRVTIIAPNKETYVSEFCPYADEKLNAKMEASIKYLPMTQPKNNRPGFSAVVRIFNPGAAALDLVNRYATWPIGAKTAAAFYANRCDIKIEAGYWNSEEGRRDYGKELFLGHLNTSAYYRRGVDNILELYFHNIKLTDDEIHTLTESTKVSKDPENYSEEIYQAAISNTSTTKLVGSEEISWRSFVETKIIPNFDSDLIAAPKQSVTDSFLSNAGLMSSPNYSPIVAKKLQVNFIDPPENLQDPGVGAVLNPQLAGQAAYVVSSRGLVINGNTLREAVQEACDFYPGGMRWNRQVRDTVVDYYFWLVGGVKTGLKKTTAIVRPKNTVVIYNYQNLVEIPSIDGAGQLTIKMMFNRNVVGGGGIELRWEDGLRFGYSISDPTKGVSTTAQMGNYWPALQGGEYAMTVRAQRYGSGYNKAVDELGMGQSAAEEYARQHAGNGSIFNTVFTVGYVTHNLSTHGNAWYTIVRTLPLIAQVTIKE